MIRLLLADDQKLFRQALASLLALEDDMEVIGQAQDGLEVINLTLMSAEGSRYNRGGLIEA